METDPLISDAWWREFKESWRPYLDRLQANAVRFLLDGTENEAAGVLLSCTFDMSEEELDMYSQLTSFTLRLMCPREIYDTLSHPNKTNTPIRTFRAIKAAAPDFPLIKRIVPKFQTVENLDENWRDELRDIAGSLHSETVFSPVLPRC